MPRLSVSRWGLLHTAAAATPPGLIAAHANMYAALLVMALMCIGFTARLVTHDAEEALFMPNRVIAPGNCPAAIKADTPVDLPFPQHHGDPRLADLQRQILGLPGLDAD
jgi:ABC-type nitrate/sulfonate/bicarbonate transport system ATPase subunit